MSKLLMRILGVRIVMGTRDARVTVPRWMIRLHPTALDSLSKGLREQARRDGVGTRVERLGVRSLLVTYDPKPEPVEHAVWTA